MPGAEGRARRAARPAALLGALLLALAAWLLSPLHPGAPGPSLQVLLIDVSGSVRRTRPDWSDWLRRTVEGELRAAEQAGREVLVIRYAAEVELSSKSEAAREPRESSGEGSDLHGALALLAAWTERHDRSSGRARLLCDGGFTGADPRPLLARLSSAGLAFELVPPPAPSLPDLALTGLTLPRGIEPGAPLAAEVELRLDPWRGAGREALVRLEFELESVAGLRRLEVERTIPLDFGDSGASRPWSLRVELGALQPGRSTLRVRARLDGDPVPENDVQRATLFAGDELVIALVASDEARAGAERWLGGPGRLPGIQIAPLEARELADSLFEFDALVSVDLSAADLARLSGGGLEDFVARGGGWLACGGARLFAGPLGELLPLRPAREERPTRDVVLLLDGSGSMAGAPFEAVRRAALDALELARPSDRFALRFFTDALEREHVLGAGGEGTERAARVLLTARLPRGPTDVLAALEEFAAQREAAGRPALALLLSDGRDQPGGPAALAQSAELRERLAAADVRLAVIALGERAELEFLGTLVGAGQRVFVPEGPDALVELFRDELAGERLQRGTALAVHAAEPASLPAAAGAAGLLSALRATAADGFPPLERIHRARPRTPDTAVLLRGPRGDPLLAYEPAGLGRVAAWASAPLAGWGPLWTGRPELLAPLLRTLARRSAAAPRRRVRLAGERWRVEGVADWPALVAGRLRPLESGERGERGPEPLSVSLSVPLWSAGGDPLAVRELAFAGRLPWAGRTVLEAEGERFLLPGRGGGEFLARSLKPSDLPTVPGPRGSLPGGEVLARGPHPLALWPLLAGLGLCAAAALLGWERRARGLQGKAPPGR